LCLAEYRSANSTHHSPAPLADGSRLSTPQQKNYSARSANFLLFRFGSGLYYLLFLIPPTPPTTTPKNQLNFYFICVPRRILERTTKKMLTKIAFQKAVSKGQALRVL
jgi:hypothetical protein